MRASGKDGVLIVGALTLKFIDWKYTGLSKNIESPAGGDTGTARIPLRDDWKIEGTATWDVGSFGDPTQYVGTTVACALKDKSSAPDVSIAKTGLLDNAEINAGVEDKGTIKVSIICNDGADHAHI